MAASYADVEIRIGEKQANSYPVEITVNTETGQQEYSGGCLDASTKPVVSIASFADNEYGLKLFHWLFADANLRAQWHEIRGEHKRRRVRLRIAAGAPELHEYPWESVVETDDAPHHPEELRLAAADATPFSRYLAGKWQPGKPIITRPVRILVAVANPSGLAKLNPPLDPIPQQDEWIALNKVLHKVKGEGRVEMTLLSEPCTLKRLADELRKGKGYHILHLVCHGVVPVSAIPGESGTAFLYLADDNNEAAVRVSDEQLAEQLRLQLANSEVEEEDKLRLVFLASCQTAKRSAYDAFRGVAPRLVGAGVPAVLAMQDNVGVEAARKIAGDFYGCLLDHGQVDLATNQARGSLLADAKEANNLQAAIPALFMRLKDGQLLGMRGLTSDDKPLGFWMRLIGSIEMGLCTVFLGPHANLGVLPPPAEISAALARQYGYPMEDKHDLARVARYVAIQNQAQLPYYYLRYLAQSVPRYLGLDKDDPKLANLYPGQTLSEVIEVLGWSESVRSIQENELHLLLADLRIGLYVTTNADSLMYAALAHKIQARIDAESDHEKRKTLESQLPRRVQPRWQTSPQWSLDVAPTPDHPVVFHLNGYDEDRDHLVLSEDDYLQHLVRLVSDQESLLPGNVIGKLGTDSLIFIGYELDDWEFRVILQGLLSRIAQSGTQRHVGVQLAAGPAHDQVAARKYLEDYLGHRFKIDIYWGGARQFVSELHSRWKHYLETGDNVWK